jgi:hypothetical protein
MKYPNWIKTSEKMPPENTPVLMWADGEACVASYHRVENQEQEGYNLDALLWRVVNNVTHWMPIPEPPKP